MNDTKNTAVFSLDQQQTPIKRKEFMGIFISWNIWVANTFYNNTRPKVSMEILKIMTNMARYRLKYGQEA